MVASGGVLSEGYGHGGSGACLGDGQMEAEGISSLSGRADALLRRMSSNLTRYEQRSRTMKNSHIAVETKTFVRGSVTRETESLSVIWTTDIPTMWAEPFNQ